MNELYTTAAESVDTAPTQSQQLVRLRPFPYPYQAALAICNDLDELRTFTEMKAVHDVLNGHKMTPCGPGLGLEVGDSMHFFTVHPYHDDTLAYFDGLTKNPGPDAEALRAGIKSGLLDILHTWGNYSQKGGFFREQALWAVEEMEKYGLNLPVWANHGDRHNFQNLVRPDALGDLREISSVRGDRSPVLEYHSDLLARLGIRYLWIKELTSLIGQERPLNWQDGLDQGPDLARSFLKNLISSNAPLTSGKPPQISNHLLKPLTLRDGQNFFEILRYGSFSKDGSDHLPELLSLRFLRRLVEVGGACLLYMHLGKGSPSPGVPFSQDAYRALERLAQWQQSGDIWVTTASRLCRYVELRQRLNLTYTGEMSDPIISGRFNHIHLGNLPVPAVHGLTFYAPDALSEQKIVNSIIVKCESGEYQARLNPADHTGKLSYTIPLDPLPYCWE